MNYSKLKSFVIFSCFPLFLFTQSLEQKAADISIMPPDSNKVKAWVALSKEAMQENYIQGENFADSAELLAVQLNYEKGRIQAIKQKGDSYYYRSKGDQAISYWTETFNYYDQNNEKVKAASIISNIGLVKRNQGKYEEAMEAFFKALKIKEEFQDSNGVAAAYNNIAITYAIQKEMDQAKAYFFRALNAYKATNNESRYNSLLLDIGGMYREMGQTDSSIFYVQQAVDYFQENGPDVQLARAYYVLGNLFMDSEEYDRSFTAYDESIELYKSLGHTYRWAGSVLRQSEILKKQQEFERALVYANRALELAQEIDSENLRLRTYNLIYSIYKESKDFQRALEYKELADEVREQIESQNNDEAIAELQAKYESELKERQLAELNAENQAKELKVEQQWQQQIVLVALLVILLVVVIAFYNRAQTKKKNNELLLAKNEIIEKALQEKEVLFKEVHHRVKNNLQFISSLLNLQSRHVNDKASLAILNDAKNRVTSMALVHQKLYQEDNITGVDMKSYTTNLIESLMHSFKVDKNAVAVELQIESVRLDIDNAIPLGIILNELITNSIKYAFNEGAGKLIVTLTRIEQSLLLVVSDNGPGLIEPVEEEKGFGYQLIRSMTDKLKGTLSITNKDGLIVELKMPYNE
ncbi:MAG: tetratricopeptide repeat protein [Schleiferiaceae bacterium]|nr:tetratricopeptide repeat protein [Schleiferiaceae bacterium]